MCLNKVEYIMTKLLNSDSKSGLHGTNWYVFQMHKKCTYNMYPDEIDQYILITHRYNDGFCEMSTKIIDHKIMYFNNLHSN